MKKKHFFRRIPALLLCILMIISMLPISALAASEVTIDSANNSGFDYYEYLSGNGTWEDLNTPKHVVNETGDVAYCIQHKLGNPHNLSYSEMNPLDSYSSRTVLGVQIILENGYPCSKGGFTATEAQYATANAIRFWLSEEGADSQYNFTNRDKRPNAIRAKDGYEDLLAWSDELLQMARDQKLITHSISFSPSSMELTTSGDYFVGTTKVTLKNCSGGYTLDKSNLPSGTVVSGFTGKTGDTLTIKVPVKYGNQSIRLDATGYDNRNTANVFWYAPSNSSYQKLVAYADDGFQPSADGVLRMTTPVNGNIRITKTDSKTGAKLAGAVFGVYSDSACSDLVTKITAGSNGIGTSGDLTAGTYYVKEITAPSGYVVNSKVYTAKVTAAATYSVTIPNTPQKGKISITKTNADTSLGIYSLSGAVFDILSGSTVVDTVTTDKEGKATSKTLPLGTYTVRERTAPNGFVAAADKTVTLSAGKQTVSVVYGNVTVPNTPQVGKITLTKKDADTGTVLKGAVFEVYKGTTLVDTITTGSDGKATTKALPLGTYTVKEKTAPANYVLSDETHTVTLSYGGQTKEIVYSTVTATNEVQMGKIRITKANADTSLGTYSLSGAVFNIKDADGKIVDTVTTNSTGKATSKSLPLGTYSVQEITAPEGFTLNTDAKSVTLKYAGQNVSVTYGDVTIANRPQTGKITVEKENSYPAMGEYSLADAVFEIVNTEGKVADTVTTDKNGKATTKELPLGTYTVREKTAPHGFVLSKETKTVTVAYAGQTVKTVYAEVSLGNKPQTGTITVTKRDAETGSKPQGDATLYGAKYEVKDSDGNVVDTLHALGSSKVTSKELPLGTYTVTEVEPPTGYLINSKSQTVKLEYAGQSVDVTNAGTTIKDEVIKGRIHLVKFGESELGSSDLDPDLKPELEGVVFEVRLKSSGELYDTLTTDENGRATSAWLPYGTYVVTETVGKEGYIKVEPFEVFISKDEMTYDYLVEDDTVAMKIRLVKQDSATGKTIPIAGTTFRLEDSKGNEIAFEMLYPQPHLLTEFVTDESGTLYLPDELAYGTYNLYEVKAPEGYLLNSKAVTFKVNEDNAENGVITVTFRDDAAKGKISVEKTGEQLIGHETKETAYGTQYIPKYANKGLAGVTFEVIAAENIGTPDGTVYHKAGETVCEITTGADGKAATGELHLGKYFVVEKAVPSGFILDTTKHEVILEYEDQHTAIVTERIAVENIRQKASVEITKQAEFFDYENGVFYTDYGRDFVFGLYTKNQIGTIPADALVDILVTDESGKAVSEADLPLGEYDLKELAAPSDKYILLTESADVDLTAKYNTDAEFNAVSSFFNEMYKRKVAVTKVDEADENRKLPNAVFEVLTADKQSVITTFTTDSNGYGESCDLPFGKYVIREQKAPYGFVLSEKEIIVDLTKDSPAVTEFLMTNKEVKGRISIEKTAEQLTGFERKETKYGTQFVPKYEVKGLAGAVFEVYAAEDIVSFDGITYYSENEKVCELTTGETGKAVSMLLPLGSYTVREKSVPEGFVLDTAEYDVMLAYTDQMVSVVMEGVSIENVRQKVQLLFNKTAEYFNKDTAEFYEADGEGFVFGLYTAEQIGDAPADSLMDILKTGSDGRATAAADLPLGKYYLKELSAPEAGYILADTIPVELTSENDVDEIIIVSASAKNEMFKKRIGVVKVDERDENRKLEGAVFELLDADTDKVLCTFETDENGYGESCELPVGYYVLREKAAPTGFVLTDKTFIVELTPNSDEVIKITVENAPTEVVLHKTDATTAEPVPGAGITIYDDATGEVMFEGETDSNGNIVVHELPAGKKYRFVESHSPDGFAINTSEFCFEIDGYGNITGDTEITDEPICVIVEKKNAYDDKPMAGVQFALVDDDGNPVKLKMTDNGYLVPAKEGKAVFAVDKNGKAEIRYLPASEYILVENTPRGFVSAGSYKLTVTNENGTENPYRATITNSPTALKIYKVHSETNEPVTGAGFTFKVKAFIGFETLKFTKLENGWYMRDDNGKLKELMVDKDGTLTVLGLPLDTEVYIEESTVPAGFFANAAQTVTLASDNTYEIPMETTITNAPAVKLGMDTDKYNVPIAIGITVLGVGVVVWRIIAAKKKKSKEKTEE